MGTSPGFAAWFDRVSLSNAAGQDNRCLSMAVDGGAFQPGDVHRAARDYWQKCQLPKGLDVTALAGSAELTYS
ncbi:hypothetical protein [Pseudomonas putida]|uniref:hypothetical protein n=1 Tax=Pseudomonas putida TaxID=303 RepID=UPI002764CF6C|nr:hypothetical protein [Pseudomonas putida]MDP9522541.1 hypothetical protein [Pseudomonas putida]